MKISHFTLVIGVGLVLAGLFVGNSKVSYSGVNCGNAFSQTNAAAKADRKAEVGSLTNTLTGSGPTNIDDHHYRNGCADARASRSAAVHGMLAGGIVIGAIGLGTVLMEVVFAAMFRERDEELAVS